MAVFTKELSGRVYIKEKKSAAQINWNDIFMVASFGASANPLAFHVFVFFSFPPNCKMELGGRGCEKGIHEFIKDAFCWCYTTVP